MPTKTYKPIATTTLGSASTPVTFSSIPSNYTDLVIIANSSAASGQAFLMRFNGDTGSNYSETALYGTGSVSGAYRDSNTIFAEIGGIWNSPETAIINIMSYANTSIYKTILTRTSDAANRAQATISLWRSTTAINSITLFPNSSINFNAGSTFTLYGIE